MKNDKLIFDVSIEATKAKKKLLEVEYAAAKLNLQLAELINLLPELKNIQIGFNVKEMKRKKWYEFWRK